MIQVTKIYSLLEKGNRKNIEDSIFPMKGNADFNSKVFLVCDGVGGESKGEVASKIVAETIGKALIKQKQPIKKDDILSVIQKAIDEIKNYILDNADATRMSTTLTLAVIQKDGIWVAWCGDSKIYHFREGKVQWKSKDHSLVQHLIDIGEIDEEIAKNHPRKNVITRSISANAKLENIDFHFIKDIKQGDYLLLASDGIFEQMDEVKFSDLLKKENSKKDILVYNICEEQTNDNYSMYLLGLGVNHKKSFKTIGLFAFISISILSVLMLNYFHLIDLQCIVLKILKMIK
jgi:PPM family protein phosphatase